MAPPRNKIVERRTPDKQPNDPNSYRILTLSDGLQVCLISQPKDLAPTPRRNLHRGPRFHNRNASCFDPLMTPLQAKLLVSEGDQVWKWMESLPGEFVSLKDSLICPCLPTRPSIVGQGQDGWKKDGSPGGGRRLLTTVAATVGVGSLDNPNDCQGLAHFTEHMVHYGSGKYPKEDQRDLIVMNFGTNANAYTTDHHTTYYYEVPEQLSLINFDMFADMLSHPTLAKGLMRREVKAVDNEFHLKRHIEDLIRIMLIQEIGVKAGHPLSKFSCGNLETLGAGGTETQAEMREFHNENYVASATTLCITSTDSLDELEGRTMEYFSKLLPGERQTFQNRDKTHPSKVPLLQLQQTDSIVILQGVSSWKQLTLVWELPASIWMENENEKVDDMLRAMLMDTSAGSLDECLREKGLILSLAAHSLQTSYGTLFLAEFRLTEDGLKDPNEIVNATFAYIDTLKKTNAARMERLFEELRVTQQKYIKYGPTRSPVEHVAFCAEGLQYSDSDDGIFWNNWMNARFNHARVIDTLKLFQLKNMIMIVTFPREIDIEKIKVLQDAKAKFRKARYTEAKYATVPRNDGSLKGKPLDFRFSFVSPSSLLDNEVFACGSGDAPQPPYNYGDIKPQVFMFEEREEQETSTKVMGVHVGHYADGANPYWGCIGIEFFCPELIDVPFSRQVLELWTYYIHVQLAEHSMEITRSGYKYLVEVSPDGIVVSVEGVGCDLEPIINEIILTMFDVDIKDDTFRQALEIYKGERTWKLGNPTHLVGSVYKYIFAPKADDDEMGVPASFTRFDLENVIREFKISTVASVALAGNVPTVMFQRVGAVLEEQDFSPLRANHNPLARPQSKKDIPLGEKCIRMKSSCMECYASTIVNFYTVSNRNPKDSAMFQCAMNFMMCHAFHHLRTTKQLGYVVGSLLVPDVPMTFAIYVCPTAKYYNTCEINQEIDEFLEAYRNYLGNTSEEDFQLMAKLKSPQGEHVKLAEVVQWYNYWFGEGFAKEDRAVWSAAKGIRKLSLQILGKEAKSCSCPKCKSIIGWKEDPSTSGILSTAVGSGEYEEYFVDQYIFKND